MSTNDKPLDGLRKLIEEGKKRCQEDAARYANHPGNVCQLCGATGEDKRSLFVDCGYDVHEAVQEAINIRLIRGKENWSHQQGFYLRLCKTCRGRFLEHLRVWATECRAMRDLPKDSDGSPQSEDPERNIPCRIDGAVVMLTWAEWDAYQSQRHGLRQQE